MWVLHNTRCLRVPIIRYAKCFGSAQAQFKEEQDTCNIFMLLLLQMTANVVV